MVSRVRAYLALGSNLGDRLGYLRAAVAALDEHTAISVVAVSRVYETDPVGGPVQDDYLNAVVAIDTDLAPLELLAVTQALEAAAARVRGERWGPRTLDVDVLLYAGVESEDPTLTLPHPRMWERGFVLAPLRDVAPDLVPEVTDESVEGVRPVPGADLRR